MKSRTFLCSLVLGFQLVWPGSQLLAAPEISRKINGGTIREVQTPKDAEHYEATLFWEPDGGEPVVIDRAERSLKFDPHWTLRNGYFDGNQIALWRTKVTGMTEYWQFTEKEGSWRMTGRAFLGTTSGEGFEVARFTSVRTLELLNGNKVSVRFEITEQPRSGDVLYRKVLRNGVEWVAPGTFVGTETEESLAAEAAKSGAAAVAPAPTPAPTPVPVEKPVVSQEKSPQTKGQSEKASATEVAASGSENASGFSMKQVLAIVLALLGIFIAWALRKPLGRLFRS